MIKRIVSASVLASIALMLLSATAVLADVKLPAVFDDNMVIQQEMPIRVWGWGEPGEKVTVKFKNFGVSATAGDDGMWRISLPSMKADGKVHAMTVSGKNTVTLKNVVLGEVWVGSGQSNMEWQLARATGGKQDIAAAKFPQIRLLHVKKVTANEPADDIKPQARWAVCSPETAKSFSAVLYYFGRRLHGELKVPVGLINSSWGGSPIEPWTVTKDASGKMYNAMIAPLQPFSIRGAIWYQGETNVIKKNGLAYAGKMKDLIEGWRRTWRNPKMPFYYVQIAPWDNKRYADGELPALWQAQVAALKLPNTGMAVVTDLVDNLKDIHPQNKQPVGDRLALWALAKDYGRDKLVYSGPLYKSMKVEGDKIRLAFAHAAGGLKSRDRKPLNEFQIAGADGKFVEAKAMIDGETVVIGAEGVRAPKAVRFGWHRAANPNLVNAKGLPASPFTTENWTGGTGE